MTLDLATLLTVSYAACNVSRLAFYVPQWVAVARDQSAARAISMISWTFWTVSHAVTAIYCFVIVEDALLGAMMLGNAVGCTGVLALTALKRRRYRRGQPVSPHSDGPVNVELSHSLALTGNRGRSVGCGD